MATVTGETVSLMTDRRQYQASNRSSYDEGKLHCQKAEQLRRKEAHTKRLSLKKAKIMKYAAEME